MYDIRLKENEVALLSGVPEHLKAVWWDYIRIMEKKMDTIIFDYMRV